MGCLLKLIRFKTLKGKMIILFLTFLVIPFFIISYFMDRPLEKIIEGKIGDSTQNALNITALTIENFLEGMLSSITLFSMNDNLVNILKSPDMYSDYEKYNLSNSAIYAASNTYLWNTESFITIMDLKKNLYASWMHTRNTYGKLEKYPWFTEVLNSNGNFIWIYHKDNFIENNTKHLFSVARIIDEFKHGDVYGIAMISIYENSLRKILQKAVKAGSSRIALIDNTGMILSHTEGFGIGGSLEQEPYYEEIVNKKQGYTINVINGEKTMVNYCTVGKTNWKIIHLTPYSVFFKEIFNIKHLKLAVLAGIFIIFTIITVFISLRVAKPIKELRNKMLNIKENLNQLIPVKGSFEISDLVSAYNEMTEKITTLLSNIKKEQKLKDEMKFKALQAQINPHFILNTLNNIKFMAHICQAKEVAEMITALGAIMEESIGRGKDIITLQQELEYIKYYVYLQKIRYNDKFSVSYNVPEELMECLLFKFMLQPIVENSIYHGLESMKRKGLIDIAAQKAEADMIITITDNGVGMKEEKLADIRNHLANSEQPRETGRIGLKNIHERIRLNYGTNYGIKIDSQVNVGTTITIVLPYSKYTAEESPSNV